MTIVSEVSLPEAVVRFNEAFGRGDAEAVVATMTEDCVFESTAPPDGRRFVGREAVRAAWAEFFATSVDPEFTVEDWFACDDRVVVTWRYAWESGHVRGVDLFVLRDGLVAEKVSYVKG